MIRRKGREIAVQLLYQIEVSGNKSDKVLEDYKRYFNINDERAFNFGEELVKGVIAHQDFIDNLIRKYSKDWSIERLSLTDKNILRLAIFEFFFRPDIPPVVSINEAVELAKIFGTDESPVFINGILDKIYKNEILKKESPQYRKIT